MLSCRVDSPRIVFFRCSCGKLHTNSLIGWSSVCSKCGVNLKSIIHAIEGHR